MFLAWHHQHLHPSFLTSSCFPLLDLPPLLLQQPRPLRSLIKPKPRKIQQHPSLHPHRHSPINPPRHRNQETRLVDILFIARPRLPIPLDLLARYILSLLNCRRRRAMTEEEEPFRGRFLCGGDSGREDEEKHSEERRDDRAVLCCACARRDFAVDTG